VKIFNRALLITGEPIYKGGYGYDAIEYDKNGHITRLTGATVPTGG